MIENYTFNDSVKDFKVYDEKDSDIDKIIQTAYFIETALDYDYYRESSTSGMFLSEIEDLLIDLQALIEVYEKVQAADEAITLYLNLNEDNYIRGDLAFAKPKIESIESMVDDIADRLVSNIDRYFVHLCPLGTKWMTKDGIKAFWTVYQ